MIVGNIESHPYKDALGRYNRRSFLVHKFTRMFQRANIGPHTSQSLSKDGNHISKCPVLDSSFIFRSIDMVAICLKTDNDFWDGEVGLISTASDILFWSAALGMQHNIFAVTLFGTPCTRKIQYIIFSINQWKYIRM